MRRLLFIFLAGLFSLNVHGTNDTITQAPRPKVGLVLAGGGARGASFIGVLKYFEELDIPIDYVIGTSMGSVIGGVYALGYSPDEMAEIIRSVNWSKYVGNSLDRSVLSTQLRERHSTQLFNIPVNAMGIFKEGIINAILSDLPNAYVNNRALDNLLDRLCHGYQDEMDFNDLPIPFACIATDIVAGDEVVLRSGSLPKAIRASMAFPVIFSPVVIDGKLLYDGGLANLFPADVLNDMGADVIIGIEFAKDKYFTGGDNPAFAQIADYLYNFAIHFKRDENKKLCDILIKPNISNFTALSFSSKAIDTLIDRGYQEAQKHHDELAQLKHRIDSMAGHPVGKELQAPKAKNLNGSSVFVNNIEISGVPENQTKWLMHKGKLKPGRPVTMDDIERATDIIRGTGAFHAVTYELVETDSVTKSHDLFLRLQSSNPDRYGLGIRYDNEDGAALMIDLGLNENRLTGWKLNLKGRLSFNPRITTIATYSVFPVTNLSLSYDYQRQLMKMSIPNLGSVRLRSETQEIKGYLSTFQTLNLDASLGFSLVFTRFNEVSINDFESDTLLPVSPSTSYFTNNQLYGPYFSIKYDNLDDSYFATRGVNTTIGGHLYFDPSHPNNPYKDLSLSFQSYLTPFNGKITLVPQLYSRVVFNDAPYANFWNTMGGEVEGRHSPYQMPFVGFNNMLATNNLSTILRCDVRYNFLRSHYISATYNFMFGYDNFEQLHDFFSATHYSGIGLRYSFNSLFGPLSFTTQWSDYDRRFSLYFSFGYYF